MKRIEISVTYRVLCILKLLLEQPDQHTKKMLAEDYNVSIDTISRDFMIMRIVGFNVIHSGYPDYKYSIAK